MSPTSLKTPWRKEWDEERDREMHDLTPEKANWRITAGIQTFQGLIAILKLIFLAVIIVLQYKVCHWVPPPPPFFHCMHVLFLKPILLNDTTTTSNHLTFLLQELSHFNARAHLYTCRPSFPRHYMDGYWNVAASRVFFLLIPEGELVTPDLFPVLTQCYEDKSGYVVLLCLW